VLTLLLSLFGCDGAAEKTSSAEKIQVSYEPGLLPKLMSIPGKPISVKWQIDESKFNAGSLIALLEYSAEDKLYILKNSHAYENISHDRIGAGFYDSWIPASAKKGIEVIKHDSVYELKGVIPVLPNLFTRTELSPYVNGRVTPLAGGYILVSLYSM